MPLKDLFPILCHLYLFILLVNRAANFTVEKDGAFLYNSVEVTPSIHNSLYRRYWVWKEYSFAATVKNSSSRIAKNLYTFANANIADPSIRLRVI